MNKKRCFGIFIDFSSTSKILDHQTPFQKLEEKTSLIRALYSRTKIQLGDEITLPNQGVAQGYLISPALFNIYSEGFLKTLESETKICEEDLLGYANDILIICDDLHNTKLNEKKIALSSSLVVMKFNLSIKDICGFPICKEYKYFVLRLTNKLSSIPLKS